MFSSSCSLRSSSCAALIALAAAAGISRFEPAPAKPDATLPPIVRVLASVQKYPRTPTYPISIAACADASPIAPATLAAFFVELSAPIVAEATAAGWPPGPLVIASEIAFFDRAGAVPTARDHSYPYAVGPPPRGNDHPLRAAGNALPGDSSARRSQVSRIARVFISFPSAPLMRLTASGPKLAESISSPSSALRAGREPAESGEPEFPPPPSPRRALCRVCKRRRCIFSS